MNAPFHAADVWNRRDAGDPAKPLWGKYRGKVVNDVDPLMIGRIQAEVAILPGLTLNWCMPCSPYAGAGVGFFAIPPVGANVWVEFEGGDVNFPIWVGAFWAEGETPVADGEPPNPLLKVWKTAFTTFVLNDTPGAGGAVLECIPGAVATPLRMTFDTRGVSILAPPASLTMLTETGITLTYPPSVLTMTEGGTELAVPASTVLVTEELVSVVSPAVDITAEEGIVAAAGADVSIGAGGAVSIEAGAAATVTAGEAVAVTASEVLALTGALVLIN